HLLLNLWEILRRDAMRELDIIIKAVLNRRPGRELRLGPQPQHGGRHHMSARMPDAFQLGHLFTILHKKKLLTTRWTQIFQKWLFCHISLAIFASRFRSTSRFHAS